MPTKRASPAKKCQDLLLKYSQADEFRLRKTLEQKLWDGYGEEFAVFVRAQVPTSLLIEARRGHGQLTVRAHAVFGRKHGVLRETRRESPFHHAEDEHRVEGHFRGQCNRPDENVVPELPEPARGLRERVIQRCRELGPVELGIELGRQAGIEPGDTLEELLYRLAGFQLCLVLDRSFRQVPIEPFQRLGGVPAPGLAAVWPELRGQVRDERLEASRPARLGIAVSRFAASLR